MDQILYESFSSLRSRGGQGLPAFVAARLASRIATICLACDLVSSRRLPMPPPSWLFVHAGVEALEELFVFFLTRVASEAQRIKNTETETDANSAS